MKNLTLIIHANAQQDMGDQLHSMDQVSGFTFSHVEGHGSHIESDSLMSERDKVVGYTSRVRVDILLQDSDVNAVLDTLRNSTHGIANRGIYWVTNVEQNGRL